MTSRLHVIPVRHMSEDKKGQKSTDKFSFRVFLTKRESTKECREDVVDPRQFK